MDPSLFAAIRIVAHVLVVDRDFNILERKWFVALIAPYGLTKAQREILRGDLKKPGGDIEGLHAQIYRPIHRERLLKWANEAMNSDGHQHPDQKRLCAQIERLNALATKSETLQYSAQEYAKAILESHKEARLWVDLKEAGQMFSQRLPYFYFGHGHAPFFLNAMMVRGLSSGNRFVLWTFVVFLVLAFLVQAIF
jgi:hypothetical protein